MMHLAEIDISETKDRCDPNYFVFHKKLLNSRQPGIKIFKLGELVKNIFRGKSPGREGYIDQGVLVLKSVNIGNYFLETTRFSYAKEDFYQKNKKFNPKAEEIILTSTGDGTVGRAIIFLPEIYEIDKCLITEKITILRNIDRQKISPYYLLAFLWSKYGKLQLEMYSRGSTGRTELYPKDIAKVVILVPEWNIQKQIEELVKKAHEKKKLADEKYEKAERILYELLGFDGSNLEFEKTFEVEAKEVFSPMRFDVEYYQPKYKKVIEILNKSGVKVEKLERVVNISAKKTNPKANPMKQIKYVELSDINPSTGEIESFSELYVYNAPSRARMVIRSGDILVASLSGSLDNIGIVSQELDGEVASTGFLVINSENYLSEFLFLLFRSEIMRKQLEQKTAGTIMTAVPKGVLGDLLVPIIPKQKQENIAELVKQSFALRKETKQLLDKATKRVVDLNREADELLVPTP
jgi:type I restriction enzyme S subunit